MMRVKQRLFNLWDAIPSHLGCVMRPSQSINGAQAKRWILVTASDWVNLHNQVVQASES